MRRTARSGPPSAVRRVYLDSFVRHVQQLFTKAFSAIDRRDLARSEETVVTGRLVDAMRTVISAADAPAWASRLAVHEDRPLSGGPAEGKRRPRIDIEIERVERGPRPCFQIESKRLHRADSVAEYVGVEGLGAFLDGTYASGHTRAGMLGYVQTDTITSWVDKIRAKLSAARKTQSIAGTPDALCHLVDDWYASTHDRAGDPIEILHGFLMCHDDTT